jgi:hypothetical protein
MSYAAMRAARRIYGIAAHRISSMESLLMNRASRIAANAYTILCRTPVLWPCRHIFAVELSNQRRACKKTRQIAASAAMTAVKFPQGTRAIFIGPR